MDIEILGYKYKENTLEIGLYTINKDPISTFIIESKLLGRTPTIYTYLNNEEVDSLRACLSSKSFFYKFDHKEFTIEEAVTFLNSSGYLNLTGEL